MMILLYIALGYLLITSGILLLNRRDFTPLEPIPRHYFDEQAPEVSICIPARNEAKSIERCVRSAVDQQYPNHHVYVLDDNSTDGTTKILHKLEKSFPNKLSILNGKPKPNDWLGKSWACHQLSQTAEGDIFIFVDADTWMEPKAVAKTVRAMGRDIVDLITLWPRQKLDSFWEKTVIPLVYFALLTLLPVRYAYRPPKWIPPLLKRKLSVHLTAACGQFMAFKKKAYRAIGGHQSVKNNIVEDVELAKNIRKNGYTMKMYHGNNTISCKMYSSSDELWQGFRKNFLAGYGDNIFVFVMMSLLHIISFIFPVILLPFLLINGSPLLLTLCLVVIVLMLLQRVIIDKWFNWDLLFGFLHPLGVGWFQFLGIQVLADYFKEAPVQWKERRL